MPQQQPGIGADVSSMMPAVGADVSHLMGGADTAPAGGGFVDSATNFLTNFAHNVDPRPALKLLYDTASGFGGMLSGDVSQGKALTDDLKGLGRAQLDQFKKAKAEYDAGRISEAVGHTIAGALPLVGPAAAKAGEQIASGDVYGGLGSGAGLLAATVGPSAVAKVVPARLATGFKNPNPVAAEAVAFGQKAGIPVDAATATGSPIIATIQKRVSDSLGGAGVAERFKASQAAGLSTVGEQLAAKANAGGKPVTPEQAGAGAQSAVAQRVADLGTEADTAYSKLRAIEAQTPIPVDLTKAKAALEPLYRTMAVGADIAPLQGAKANAVRAIARILEGPDVASASEVDSALSDLKALQRSAADTPGSAAANAAVHQVHQAVISAVSKAGPDALKALNEGRIATTKKYAAVDVRDALEGTQGEPVAAYKRLTAPGDSAIGQLRDVAKQAPQAVPQIARAVLDDFVNTATEAGGFEHAAKLETSWRKLGDETKSVLFRDPAYVSDLANFFRLARKIAENPNPSGTARVNNLFNATSAVVGYPVAKLLYSKAGVKVLTEGFRVPLQSPTLVGAYTTRLTAALQAAMQADPAMADDTQRQTPPTIGQR